MSAVHISTRAGTILGFTILCVLAAASLPFLRSADNLVRDVMLTALSPWVDPGSDIVLVTVDETTLTRFSYRSPVDRAFLADLISKIAAAKPKVITIDILFDQSTEANKDAELRQAFKAAGVPIITAFADSSAGLTDEQAAFLRAFNSDTTPGAAELLKDGLDGTVRWIYPGRNHNGTWIAGLASAAVKAAGQAPDEARLEMTYFRTDNAEPYRFRRFPAHTAALLPAQWFAGKIVMVGTTLPSDDRHRTPFAILNGHDAGHLPGIVIHAHATAQLMVGARLHTVDGIALVLLTALVAALAFAAALLRINPFWRAMVLAGLCVGLWMVCALVFKGTGTLIPPVIPTATAFAVNVMATLYLWNRDRQRKRFIEDAFSHYVSPAYVRELIAHPEKLHLGGQKQDVTYVFTDIAGFTNLVESNDAEAITARLNAYLDGVSALFLKHGATIDKFIGDAVVGFFGAPVEQRDHARRALDLVLDVDRFSEVFRAETGVHGLAFGSTRIGVHTGEAVIGNFGGSQFFDYTGIGDTVNTAARLESANKFFGTRICVSGETAKACPDHMFRPIGTLILKGKTESIDAFEPMAREAANSPDLKSYLEAYELLRRGDDSALRIFEKLAGSCPNDGLIQYHLSRLRSGDVGTTIRLDEK